MSPVVTYQKEVHTSQGFFATWPPNSRIEPGDLGVLVRGRFKRVTSLEELGISHDLDINRMAYDVGFASATGATVTVTERGDGDAGAATIALDFTEEGAFVFQAFRLRSHRVSDLAAVGRQAWKAAYKRREWRREWLMVESVQVAERGTIVISRDTAASLVFQACAEEPISTLSLADPKVDLTIASSSGKTVQMVGATDLRPMYSCLRLRHPWSTGTESDQESPFSHPGIDVLLTS